MDDTKPTNVVPMYIACANGLFPLRLLISIFLYWLVQICCCSFLLQYPLGLRFWVAAPQCVEGPGPEMEFLHISNRFESSAPCHSQSLLLADFKENRTLLLVLKIRTKKTSSLFIKTFCRTEK
jgi:hypothetical protein